MLINCPAPSIIHTTIKSFIQILRAIYWAHVECSLDIVPHSLDGALEVYYLHICRMRWYGPINMRPYNYYKTMKQYDLIDVLVVQ